MRPPLASRLSPLASRPLIVFLTCLLPFLITLTIFLPTLLVTPVYADIGQTKLKNRPFPLDRLKGLNIMMPGSQPSREVISSGSGLIVNGDFEAGNSGFTSDYTYSPGNLNPAGRYAVLTDPNSAHGQATSFGDHTTGYGLMMAVNGANLANQIVWSQTVQVFPYTDYEFSAWVASWYHQSPAHLQFRINGNAIGTFVASSTTGIWHQFAAVWNAAVNTSAVIEIINLNTASSGNDFALDDLAFAPLLLDRMIWSAAPECPVCSASNAVGWAGGPINTRNGNLSYQETDLLIPVKGESLTFRRSYASQAVTVYTTTLGHGWTHNYDMHLHFHGTSLTDTIELQSPGGSRLPFYDNGDNTYTPYAGVTAQLVYSDTSEEFTVTGFNQATYIFNNQGQLIEQIDPFGNSLYFSYDNDQLSQVGQGDRYLTYSYDETSGRLIQVRDHLSRTITLTYDGNGDLVSVTKPMSLTSSYEYSGTTHLLTKVTDPAGVIVEETAYDDQGRAYRQWDGSGNLLMEINYTLTNTHIISQSGVVMTHTYTLRGTLIEVTYGCTDNSPGCGMGSDIGYDYHFKARQAIDPKGNITQIKWSDNGSNLEQISDALEQNSFFTYNALNSLNEIENARGYTTTYSYEDNNLPTFRTSTTNALQQTTMYTPTAAGLLEAERDPNGLITRYWYNEYGQITQTVRAYNTTAAITTTYGYDAAGRLIITTQVTPDDLPLTTLNVYDAADWLIATIHNWTGTNPANWANDCLITPGPRDYNICTRYGYDHAGRTISTTNTLGQTNLTFYDAAGRPYLQLTNYDGTPDYQTNPVSTLCDWETPDLEHNLCTLTSYDSYGRVVSTTNVLGRVDRTFYDSLGRVQAAVVNSVNVTDDWQECTFPPAAAHEDLCTIYTYDAVGNVIAVKDPAGRVTLTVYDPLNRVKGTIINWDDNIDLDDCYTSTWLNQTERAENVCTRYLYDELGSTIIVSDTLGRMSRTFYDELNRVVGTISHWDGLMALDDCWPDTLPAHRDYNLCTRYAYDAAGNQTTLTNPLGQMNLTVYDAANRPFLQVTNWDGTSTTWPDDCADTATYPQAVQNLCALTSYDSLGRRASLIDALGHVTEFAYDGLGRVITTTRYLDSQPITTTVTYDALGSRLNQTDGENHTLTYLYDSLNRPIVTLSHEVVAITTTYNAAGWVMGTLNNLGHTTVNTYDTLGRLAATTDGEDHTTQYQYDALGNQIAMIDAEGVVTVYTYDTLNRLVTVLENETINDPDHENNLLTQYRYDVLGNRIVITNALGYTSTHTLYDTLNRPIIVRDALGHETHYQYNLLGQRVVMTDANGDITLYSYDTLNRLILVSYETDNETVEYAYNALGHRLTMTDTLGVTTYQYDDFSRLITVTAPLTGTVGYGYDWVGNRVLLTYPNGYTVTYRYDGDDRLVEAVDWQEGVTTYQYDAAGRLITTTLPNGVITINSYDAANRLTNLTHKDPNDHLLASYSYQLDNVGNRVVATETMRLPFQAGPDTLTSASDGASQRQYPAAAYNSEEDQYLVVWQGYDDTEERWYIYGQLVASDGSLLEDAFVIAGRSTEPAVAYNPQENHYLVVWRNNDNQIEASYISHDGIPDSPILIAERYFNRQPKVAYNPDDGTFTIVWYNLDALDTHAIYAYKVEDQAQPVLVANGINALTHPALAISQDGTHLVVWQDNRDSQWDIYSQRLESDLTLVGSNTPLADSSDNELTPDVAWHEAAETFLIVWHNNGGFLPQGIQGRRVLTDGTLPGTILFYSDDTTASQPAVTVTANEWWVVWQQGSPAVLYGQQVLTNGSKAGSNNALFTTSHNHTTSTLATNRLTGTLLLTWADDRNSQDTIYHAILSPRPYETTVIHYRYDPLYRLTEAQYSGILSGTYSYGYDEVGNRLTFSRNITETWYLTNTYNSANHLILTVTDQGITTTYQWDNSGRLITTTVDSQMTRLYQYNQRGLLITATVDSLVTTFLYDGQGRRRQMSVAGETTTYALDYLRNNQVLYEEGGAFANTKHYLYGLECIAELVDADEPESEWRFYHRDGQPLVRQTTNHHQDVTMAWAYSPTGGVVIGPQGPVTNLDCGGIYDWSTGLIFRRGRYFDPNTGIWITLDGAVLWQKTPRLNRAQRRWLRKHRRLLLFLCLIMVVLLLTGCGPNPDPTLAPTITPCPTPVTATATPVATSTPIPTLPPPNPATLIPTITPSLIWTPVPPTPATIPTMNSLIFANPFGAGNKFLGVNDFGSSLGAQENLGGDQGVGHTGIDVVPLNYALESKKNNYVPTQNHRGLYAPTSGIVRKDISNHKITIETVVQEGVVYVELTHVSPNEGPPDGSYVQAGTSLFPMTFKGRGHGFGSTYPHLHIGFYSNDHKGKVYHNPRDKLLTSPDYAGSYWGYIDPSDGSYFTQLSEGD